MPKNHTHLVIYNTERCLITPNTNELPLHEHLLISNLRFINHEKNMINTEKFNRVILAETKPRPSLSQRRDARLILPIIQQHLQNTCDHTEILFDPFWYPTTENQADLHAKNAVSQIASAIPESHWTQELLNDKCISDIIALAHRAANAYPDDEFTVNVYMENIDDIDALTNFFSQEKNLNTLPRNIRTIGFAYNEGVRIQEMSYPDISINGEIDTRYKTDAAHTTATAWSMLGILPGAYLPSKELTLRILSQQPTVEVGIIEPIQEEPQKSKAGSFLSYLPFINTPAPEPTGSTVDIRALANLDKMLEQDYFDNKFSTIEYLHRCLPINYEGQQAPSDSDLIYALRKIAGHDMWKQKGKAIFSERDAPNGIKKIRDSQTTSFSELVELAEEPLHEIDRIDAQIKKGYLPELARYVKRSHATVDFYYLLRGLSEKKHSNWTREHVINTFCRKYNLSYNEMKKPKPQAAGYLAAK